MTEKKKRYIKFERPDYGIGSMGYCVPIEKSLIAIEAELDATDVGDVLKLTIVELTDEEIAAAPEFTGW